MESMQTNRVITIVPQLPPVVDGVGDYSLSLACQLRQDYGVITEFIVGSNTGDEQTVAEGFAIKQVKQRTSQALLNLLPEDPQVPTTLLLHYVGYGYARRGSPTWLVSALRQWLNRSSVRQMVTMFHEVFAFGPIWTSQFWTSPMQRKLAADLVRISDRHITSLTEYSNIIRRLAQAKQIDIPTLPIFSGVGELAYPVPLAERERHLVIFGGIGARARAYQRSWNVLMQTCSKLAISKIIDIGPPLPAPLPRLSEIPIEQLGQQPAAIVSQILANALVGYIDYPSTYLGKSSIFAAYCAHGVLPVVATERTSNPLNHANQLVAGRHYIVADVQANLDDSELLQTTADQAYKWYQGHSLATHAAIFHKSLTQTNGTPSNTRQYGPRHSTVH